MMAALESIPPDKSSRRAFTAETSMAGWTGGAGEQFAATYPTTPRSEETWFKVETDLIIHGTVTPDAELIIQGEAAPVRPDGTFSFRFTLPEGRQVIPVRVVTPNGRREYTITPIVEKKTT